ncbi:MAG: hypothetical protein KAS72_11520 [Phycisphaerales bacterium]|nr:hypothetical protein [Phycisphaerales bacterium]
MHESKLPKVSIREVLGYTILVSREAVKETFQHHIVWSSLCCLATLGVGLPVLIIAKGREWAMLEWGVNFWTILAMLAGGLAMLLIGWSIIVPVQLDKQSKSLLRQERDASSALRITSESIDDAKEALESLIDSDLNPHDLLAAYEGHKAALLDAFSELYPRSRMVELETAIWKSEEWCRQRLSSSYYEQDVAKDTIKVILDTVSRIESETRLGQHALKS